MSNPPSAILIAGPTASGKSALALAVAERYAGTIINADSMQIYRDLRILTARPSVEDEQRVPHRLYGHVGAETAYSAGHYAKDVQQAIESAEAADQLPIIVGGTGLYFKVLLEGLSPVPDIDPEVRRRWRLAAETETADALHGVLARRDPEMAARLLPADRQRIVRALEVMDQTGRSLATWQETPGTPLIDGDAVAKVVVLPPREILHQRADTRFENMLANGARDEVQALMARNLDPGLPAMRALGVAQISTWLDGTIDRAEALRRGQAETRQYIKRQSTWLRKNMMSWKAISTQQTESQLADFLMFIDP